MTTLLYWGEAGGQHQRVTRAQELNLISDLLAGCSNLDMINPVRIPAGMVLVKWSSSVFSNGQ